MAETNLEVITAVLRLAGVLGEGEVASAAQGRDALRSMNDMLAEWEVLGIETGYFPQTVLVNDSPIFNDAMQACKYNLAITIAGEYGSTPLPFVAGVAQSGYGRLVRDAVNDKMEEADVSHLPGVYSGWDIQSG